MEGELAQFEQELEGLADGAAAAPAAAPAKPAAPKVVTISRPAVKAPRETQPPPQPYAPHVGLDGGLQPAPFQPGAAGGSGYPGAAGGPSAFPAPMGSLDQAEAARMAGARPAAPPPPPPGPGPPGERKSVKRAAAGQAWEDPVLADWPDDDFRLFVGNLGNDATDQLLIGAFSKYPSFQRARVVIDKKANKPRGYGFVSFKEPWDMTAAMREMNNKYVGSRPVKLKKSHWKDRNMDSAKQVKWEYHRVEADGKRHNKKTAHPKQAAGYSATYR
mmetsp:Transcript_350/g.1116  ORF Transcript_350/g.1116 Transcript_350/m.1116 type:complete len:274 (+) Transcript_350:655-1476(+)